MKSTVPVCVVWLVLASASVASAQGGVIVGVNWADVDFSEAAEALETDRRTGLAAGVFLSLPLTGTVSLQPEVLYSQKGMKFSEAGADVTMEIDYLDIPVLARVASGSSGLAFFAGPSFGFKVRARGRAELGGEEISEDVSDEVASFDLGVIVGAGFQSPRLFLDGRMQWGLSNLNKADADVVEMRNRVMSVLLGIRF